MYKTINNCGNRNATQNVNLVEASFCWKLKNGHAFIMYETEFFQGQKVLASTVSLCKHFVVLALTGQVTYFIRLKFLLQYNEEKVHFIIKQYILVLKTVHKDFLSKDHIFYLVQGKTRYFIQLKTSTKYCILKFFPI